MNDESSSPFKSEQFGFDEDNANIKSMVNITEKVKQKPEEEHKKIELNKNFFEKIKSLKKCSKILLDSVSQRKIKLLN